MATIEETIALGTQHHLAGKLDDAESAYRQVLQLQPGHAQAMCLMATLAMQRGQLGSAIRGFLDAIRADGSQPGFYANLGEAYRLAGNQAEAIRASEFALKLNPNMATSHWVLGQVFQEQGQLDVAVTEFRETLRIVPHDALCLTRLGQALFAQGNLTESEVALRQAAELEPNEAASHINLARLFYAQGKLDQAEQRYRRAMELKPELVALRGNLASVLKEQGRLSDAIEQLREAIKLEPRDDRMHSDYLYNMNFHPDYDAATIFAEHLAWAKRHAEPLTAAAAPPTNSREPGRRLRIGYVSSHFRAHAVHSFVEPILASHDHERFEVFCYSGVARADQVTQRTMGYADRWHNIVGQSDQAVSELVRGDQIDILVDLAGHIGGGRMPVFARKPAPVQVTYIGYQNTTGMTAMDYRLTDDWSDPPGTTEAFYMEKLIRLPRTFFCYLPSADAPAVPPPPVEKNGFITFGSFNNFSKVTPQVLAAWAEVLRAVNDSRMLILAKINPQLQAYVIDSFQRLGIHQERVELCSFRPMREYLELRNLVDITLDTFPFNGHTTTCDTLWQGVPVVALAGNTYCSRFGSSALVNLGLESLITVSTPQYIQIAIELAQDRARMARMRAELRETMRNSAIVDAKTFTRNLEAAYRQMWTDWCNKPVGP